MASSNYVGARSIAELAAALDKFNYAPRSDSERRTQAENTYRTQLEQALRNAQQTYEESDLALANQLIGLDTGYNRQRQSQEEAIRASISQADRHALSRGMQRSTYNNATLANIQNKGNEALARIEENRENDRAGVEAQRAQLARNLARTREGANADYQNQVIAEMQRLADEDYQRKLTADQNNNSTQLQLYATQQAEDQFNQNLQLQRDKMAQDQKQFEDQMWFNRQKEGLGWSTAADAIQTITGMNEVPESITSVFPSGNKPEECFAEFVKLYIEGYNQAVSLFGQDTVDDFENRLKTGRRKGAYKAVSEARLAMEEFYNADEVDRGMASISHINHVNNQEVSKSQALRDKLRKGVIGMMDDTYAAARFDSATGLIAGRRRLRDPENAFTYEPNTKANAPSTQVSGDMSTDARYAEMEDRLTVQEQASITVHLYRLNGK